MPPIPLSPTPHRRPPYAAAPFAWTPSAVAAISPARETTIPLISADEARPVLPGFDVWDMWPLARPDGATAQVAGGRLWFALSAPSGPDPDDRHAVARIRLLHETAGGWADAGPALPEGFSPEPREWSGSAVLEDDSRVRLFYTGADAADGPPPTVRQRLLETTGRLSLDRGAPAVVGWTRPCESVAPDGDVYVDTAVAPTAPGRIKAWRDPAYFRDPADGAEYLLFAASLGRAQSPLDGAVGLARSDGRGGWTLLGPLLEAEGVNRELERPHALVRDGRYYVFWCTQRHMFAPGTRAPTGLYGMVGETFAGPYRPLNGSGLVLANPDAAPRQAYAWWVTGEGEVTGFVDHLGPEDADAPGRSDRARFGGTPAPFLRLRFEDDRVGLA